MQGQPESMSNVYRCRKTCRPDISKVVLTGNLNEIKLEFVLFYSLGYRNVKRCTVKMRSCWDLSQREDRQRRQDEGQEEEKPPVHLDARHCRRGHRAFPLGPVAQRGVTAGDAHWVQPAGAELLVARRGDEAGPGRGTGLPVMYSCKKKELMEQRDLWYSLTLKCWHKVQTDSD